MNSSEPHWVLKTNERTWNFQNVKVEANGAEVRPHDRSVVGNIGSHLTLPLSGETLKQNRTLPDVAPDSAQRQTPVECQCRDWS
jgi:hypothetical protein